MNLTFNYSPKLFETYASFDPAIDFDNSNMDLFQTTRDPKYLTFKPGMTPTKFYLKNIDKTIFYNFILNKTDAGKIFSCFQYGIERIDNLKPFFINEEYEITNNGIGTWEPTEILDLGNRKVKHMKQEDAERVFIYQLIMELGGVVLKKTQSVRDVNLEYPVWPSSIELIEQVKKMKV